MQSVRLHQLFKKRTFWAGAIAPEIQQISTAQYRNANWWWQCQSRTLQQALTSTIGSSYSGNPHGFRYLMTMCAMLNNNETIKIFPKYKLITSEDAQGFPGTLIPFLELPDADPTKFNLYLYHIPKGKSYLKKALDEMPNLTRVQQLETHCIENTQHFIRIYRNFNDTGPNSIVVFSDQWSAQMIETLFVLLPHLIGIVSREANEEYTLTEADQEYNRKVLKLFEIFGVLYRVMYDTNTTEFSDDYIDQIKAQLFQLTTEYVDMFDFKTAQIDTFTKRLAKARNENAQNYFTEQLTSVNRRITDYEENLKRLYIEQTKYSRQLIAHKLISEDDVKPFIDTILNTKAIEVLTTSENEMILRITAPLQYFQEADFEAYENNAQSTYKHLFYNNPTLQKVLHKVFVTREYQILAQAVIHLQINASYSQSPLHLFAERQDYSSPYQPTQFPNPHLYHYNCWGAAQSEMQKNMCAGNFELVIMQMVAAVQSVNIAENASFVNGLLNDIANNENLRNKLTFIVNTPNGKQTMNYAEILEYENQITNTPTNDASKDEQTTVKREYTQVELPDNDENWDDPAERFERQHAEDIANEEGGNENENHQN